jgi:hypothetical protein
LIPGELSSINRPPLQAREEEGVDYSLNTLGFEVSSWDAQQAGLAREDTDTTGVENTAILDQTHCAARQEEETNSYGGKSGETHG